MKGDVYRLELPGDWLDFVAPDDISACARGCELLRERGIAKTRLGLYRLPITWVQCCFGNKCVQNSPQMVWVWLFNFVT